MAWHPFRHFGLKVAALALGDAAVVHRQRGADADRAARAGPLSYSNVPAGLEMTGEQIDDVNVHVRGSRQAPSHLIARAARRADRSGRRASRREHVPLRTDEVVGAAGRRSARRWIRHGDRHARAIRAQRVPPWPDDRRQPARRVRRGASHGRAGNRDRRCGPESAAREADRGRHRARPDRRPIEHRSRRTSASASPTPAPAARAAHCRA